MKRFRLGDIVRGVTHGGTPPTDNDAFWVGDIPWITGADILNQKVGDIRRYVNMKAVKTTSTNIVSKGDLLLVTRTGVGKMAVAPYDVAISQDFTGLTFNDQVADTRFLYYALQGKTNELLIFNQGTSINGVTRADLLNLELELPEKAEQTAIADILATVDQAIEQTEALIAKQRRIKAGLLHDLLTRGIDEHGHLRDPSTHGFKPSPVGLVPEEWEVVRLSEVCEFASGGTPSRTKASYWIGSIPWVKTAEVDYCLITETEEHISEVGLQNSSAKVFPRGTLLMAIYGEGVTRGKVALLGIDAATNQACLAFFPGPGLDSRFLYYWFMHTYAELRELSHDGSQKNLSAALVGDTFVPTPAMAEQGNIVTIIQAFEGGTSCEYAQLAKLQRLKSGLMQDLLSGRVSVVGLVADAPLASGEHCASENAL